LNRNVNYDFSIFKKRKSNSAKRVYQSSLPLIDNENNPVFFDFYKDDNVGISSEWRAPLVEQALDNDYETDDEVLQNGVIECLISI